MIGIKDEGWFELDENGKLVPMVEHEPTPEEIEADRKESEAREKARQARITAEKSHQANLVKDDSLQFLIHAVTRGSEKVSVRYGTFDNGNITIYAKDWEGELKKVLADHLVVNESDFQSDYHEKDRVKIYPESPYFKEVWLMSCLNLAKEVISKYGRARCSTKQVYDADQFLAAVGSTAATRKRYLKNLPVDFEAVIPF
jgi:hypothetical protein